MTCVARRLLIKFFIEAQFLLALHRVKLSVLTPDCKMENDNEASDIICAPKNLSIAEGENLVATPIILLLFSYLYFVLRCGPRFVKDRCCGPRTAMSQVKWRTVLCPYCQHPLTSIHSLSPKPPLGSHKKILRENSITKTPSASRPINNSAQETVYYRTLCSSTITRPASIKLDSKTFSGLTTSDWLLVKTPIPIILLFFSYLYFVLRCGPRFMKDRKPYKLNTFIRFYNIFQMVSNALIVYHIVDMGFHKLYIFDCIEPTYEDGTLSPRSDQLEYYILIVKIIDFTETFLFVLRKKQRQISFLHLYHHISTVFIFWYTIKYFKPGSTLTFSLYNSSVHVIMYTYYFLASFGPSMQNLLRGVKPLITVMQMANKRSYSRLGSDTLLVKYHFTNNAENFELPREQRRTAVTIMQERVGLTTSDWLLVKTPIPIILLFFSYLYFVLRCGPKFMKDRKPYKLNTFIRFYNIFQMVSNALIVYHIVDMGFHKLYIFNCIEPTYEDGSLSPRSVDGGGGMLEFIVNNETSCLDVISNDRSQPDQTTSTGTSYELIWKVLAHKSLLFISILPIPIPE
ncbi:Elongation of very long chain fatty acids protein 7 [Eufriesea mexicana]|uniref:Elongation of very long chain fatty acids protein n=1 Tax=Eufriesea mexicana TaxID=516756 RepID=A0A310SPG0_9HYME|nr:Elongation of very long chain fatty acids protein 7 [Eufriesea mexicana]